jgi:hypothetical protein
MKKLLYLMVAGVTLFSCSNTKVVIPNYTTTTKLVKLSPGMTKAQSLSTLDNLYPFDIMVQTGNGCEIQEYRYKKPFQSVNPLRETSETGLNGGDKRYEDPGKAFLVFKDQKLVSVLTNTGEDQLKALLVDVKSNNASCEMASLKGCTDPNSINYNPDAIIDDGSCKYPPCGMVKNPNYDPKRPDCYPQFIPDPALAKATVTPECTLCDILKGNSNVNINVNVDGNKLNNKKEESIDIKLPSVPKALNKKNK